MRFGTIWEGSHKFFRQTDGPIKKWVEVSRTFFASFRLDLLAVEDLIFASVLPQSQNLCFGNTSKVIIMKLAILTVLFTIFVSAESFMTAPVQKVRQERELLRVFSALYTRTSLFFSSMVCVFSLWHYSVPPLPLPSCLKKRLGKS